MPQMAPMNWLILFIFFTLIFFLYNSLNYYIINYTIKKTFNKKSKLFFTWKW